MLISRTLNIKIYIYLCLFGLVAEVNEKSVAKGLGEAATKMLYYSKQKIRGRWPWVDKCRC